MVVTITTTILASVRDRFQRVCRPGSQVRVVRRICITKVDDVKEVREIPQGYEPQPRAVDTDKAIKVYKTDVAIIGAGPAGLAASDASCCDTPGNIRPAQTGHN